MDVSLGLIFVAPLLAFALAAVTLILLLWALSKRRWLLTIFVAVMAIIFPLAVYATVAFGCEPRCSNLEGQYAALLAALAANVVALVIAWTITRSKMKIRL